jgi:aryl-alcohol dehydrogenase-like predicted oxidoreductase
VGDGLDQLGNSGALVSALALGTMNFGTPETPEDEAFAQLDAFIEAGGNLIDTADVYNGGVAEETLGRWLAARPREVTDRAVIATKGAWDPLTPIEESLSFLDSAVRTGKIRYAGLSNFTGWQLQLAVVSPQQACTWTRMR